MKIMSLDLSQFCAINNKATKDLAPVSLLTDNLNIGSIKIMDNQRIPELLSCSKDLSGQQFGRLTVLSFAYYKNGQIWWNCQCKCGNKKDIRGYSLMSGVSQSCGCLQKELTSSRTKIHGMEGSSIYHVWEGMIQRCENSKTAKYKYYGGKGVAVCERWHKFENFYKDVGDKPKGRTLDRWPDNNGNYELKNVRWATIEEQNNNKRDAKNQFWFFAFNLNTGKWDEDNNQAEFARRHNITRNGIGECLHGRQKTHKNWLFARQKRQIRHVA